MMREGEKEKKEKGGKRVKMMREGEKEKEENGGREEKRKKGRERKEIREGGGGREERREKKKKEIKICLRYEILPFFISSFSPFHTYRLLDFNSRTYQVA